MKHYLLTRSAYGPDVPIERNRQRLEILRGVTARSLAAQTERRVIWLVLIDPRDPLLSERKAALASSGLPLQLEDATRKLERSSIHDHPQGPWRSYIKWTESVLTSRIDDDDAFAPWALAAFQQKGEMRELHHGRRMIWVLTYGWRVRSGLVNLRHDVVAQFATMYAPRGDRTTIMDMNHTSVAKLAPVRMAHDKPSWLWLRHEATRSYQSGASTSGIEQMGPIPAEVRRTFPVDWALIESLP